MLWRCPSATYSKALCEWAANTDTKFSPRQLAGYVCQYCKSPLSRLLPLSFLFGRVENDMRPLVQTAIRASGSAATDERKDRKTATATSASHTSTATNLLTYYY